VAVLGANAGIVSTTSLIVGVAGARISAQNSRVEVRVIPTDAEAMIHRHTIVSLSK
jgi:acetate kinase